MAERGEGNGEQQSGLGRLDGSEEPSPLGAAEPMMVGRESRPSGSGGGRLSSFRPKKHRSWKWWAIIGVVVVALLFAPGFVSGLKKTPKNRIGISYGGGPFESAHFQRIVQPGSSLFFNGFFDPLYLYPSDQQNYIISLTKGVGATQSPDSVVAPTVGQGRGDLPGRRLLHAEHEAAAPVPRAARTEVQGVHVEGLVQPHPRHVPPADRERAAGGDPPDQPSRTSTAAPSKLVGLQTRVQAEDLPAAAVRAGRALLLLARVRAHRGLRRSRPSSSRPCPSRSRSRWRSSSSGRPRSSSRSSRTRSSSPRPRRSRCVISPPRAVGSGLRPQEGDRGGQDQPLGGAAERELRDHVADERVGRERVLGFDDHHDHAEEVTEPVPPAPSAPSRTARSRWRWRSSSARSRRGRSRAVGGRAHAARRRLRRRDVADVRPGRPGVRDRGQPAVRLGARATTTGSRSCGGCRALPRRASRWRGSRSRRRHPRRCTCRRGSVASSGPTTAGVRSTRPSRNLASSDISAIAVSPRSPDTVLAGRIDPGLLPHRRRRSQLDDGPRRSRASPR